MPLITPILASSAILSILVTRLAPQYSLGYLSSAVVLFLVQLAGWVVWRVAIYPYLFSPLRHLPQPATPSWFMGQSARIFKESSARPMQEWTETVPNDGLICYRHWFNIERVMPVSAAALAEVLVTKSYDFVKPADFRKGFGRIIGIGILLAEGDDHKLQRKNLLPAFAYRHVKDLYPIFWAKSRELVQRLSVVSKITVPATQTPGTTSGDPEKDALLKHAPGVIEVGGWSSRATLDIIGLSGMAQDFEALEHPDNKLNETYRSIFNPSKRSVGLQMLSIYFPFWIIKRLPFKRNGEIEAASAYIKDLCRGLVQNKRVALEKGKAEVDILSIALESGAFSDDDLVNQMMTFLVAGHETTATAMIWAIYELSKHPEIQDKIREEVRSKLPSLDSDITAAQLDSCHYLHAVCLEVFRVWPPVTMTMRVADRDTTIIGQMIPKGTVVIINPLGVNLSTQHWGPDAAEFKPERWLDADGKANNRGGGDSNFSFLTFLHGPRSCIGQKFAQAEFACLLAAWVGKFETEFEDPKFDNPEIHGGITAKPKDGLWVKLKEVEGW